jgi:hypothetical protein
MHIGDSACGGVLGFLKRGYVSWPGWLDCPRVSGSVTSSRGILNLIQLPPALWNPSPDDEWPLTYSALPPGFNIPFGLWFCD